MSTDYTEIRAMELMPEALDQPSDQRISWVKQACQNDPALEARGLRNREN